MLLYRGRVWPGSDRRRSRAEAIDQRGLLAMVKGSGHIRIGIYTSVGP